jgi:hypothetical protein
VKSVLFISLAVVLALSIGLIGCGEPTPPGPECPDSIMVGTARDINEAQKVFECYHAGPAMRWFVDKVNSDGGVHLSDFDTATEDCYVDLELVVRDFSVDAWDIATVVAGLIDDGADVIFGGPSTDSIYSIAPVCNLNGVILLSLEGGASKMVWESESYLDVWPYVWINLSFANWYEIPVLKGIMDEAVGGTPKAYVTYIGELGAEHGLEYLQTTMDEFGEENVLPAGSPLPGVEHTFLMGILNQEEANGIIQDAKAALNTTPYDIFCAYTYPWNVAALFAAAQNFDFNPPAMIFGPGSSQGYFTNDWGPVVVEGVMSFGTSNEKTTVAVGTPDISMADFYDAIGAQIEDDWANYATVCPQYEGVYSTATNGTELLDYWGLPIFQAGMEMWKAAVEEAGNLDNTEIRNVMASFSASDPVSTCFGDTWYHVFGGGLGGGVVDYTCMTGQIGQWQSGVFEIIGFTGIETDDWAVPAWSGNVSEATPLPNYAVTAAYEAMEGNWAWLP